VLPVEPDARRETKDTADPPEICSTELRFQMHLLKIA
jgi:hypothetical protein